MAEIREESMPIGRYIAIGLLFVVFFVGIAYLIFIITRPGDDKVVVRPTPTPTAIFTPGPAPIAAPPLILLPAPTIPPSIVKDRVFTVPIIPPAKVVTVDGVLIAQDGRGNLLFNNLTHAENFELQLARIRAENAEQLARARNEQELREAELRFKTRLAELEQEATTTKITGQFAFDQAALQSQTRVALAQIEQQTRLAELKAQLKQAKIEAASRPTFEQQRKLIVLQHEIALEQLREQGKQQQESKIIDFGGQLALQRDSAQNRKELTQVNFQGQQSLLQEQRTSQLAIGEQQTNAQLALNEQQIKATLQQMTLEQKRFFAQLAHQRAIQTNNLQFALTAQRIEGDIIRAIQSDRHFQYLERVALEAQIDAQLLVLSRVLGIPPGYSQSRLY